MTVFAMLGGSKTTAVEGARAELNLTAYLRAVRKQLGMDIAFIGEFEHGRRVFRYVDTDEAQCPAVVGHSDMLEATYCQRVVDGRLPGFMRDTRDYPEAMKLAVTEALPVGSYLGVPLRLADGKVFGTVCCFSHAVRPGLEPVALETLEMFAEMVVTEISAMLRQREMVAEKTARVREILDKRALRILYQPIIRLWQNELVGFEALSRFPELPAQRPDVWFADAQEAGLGMQLELAAIELALAGLERLPDDVDVRINASPGLVISGVLAGAMAGYAPERIVLEVTEHEPVSDYPAFLATLAPLRARGMRLAVDDAGAGHATLRHILKLRPDIIKLDISLIRDIDRDRYKSALAAALIRFALETEAEIVAEGIESLGELNLLRGLGAHAGQGNYLGGPLPLEQAAMMVRGVSARSSVV
jgi:EAL domain-containing protein (putative c-di-GMP-specific phosphodiesterase class I)